jgi:hypothetical protein
MDFAQCALGMGAVRVSTIWGWCASRAAEDAFVYAKCACLAKSATLSL